MRYTNHVSILHILAEKHLSIAHDSALTPRNWKQSL
jgi:hypothetical protein